MFLSLLLHYCLPPPGAFSDPIFLLLKFSYHRYPTCLCLCCLHICALHSKNFFPPHPLQPRGPVFNPLKVSSPALGTPSLKKGFRRRQHGACGSFPARGFSEGIWSLEPLGSRVEGWARTVPPRPGSPHPPIRTEPALPAVSAARHPPAPHPVPLPPLVT